MRNSYSCSHSKDTFYRRVREEMKRCGIHSYEELAEIAHLNAPKHLNAVITGKKKLSTNMLNRLANVFDVTPEYLTGESEYRSMEEAQAARQEQEEKERMIMQLREQNEHAEAIKEANENYQRYKLREKEEKEAALAYLRSLGIYVYSDYSSYTPSENDRSIIHLSEARVDSFLRNFRMVSTTAASALLSCIGRND